MEKKLFDKVIELTARIKVRSLQLTSVKEFVNLFNRNYERKINPEYFYWRAFESGSNSIFFEARDGGIFCGTFGLQICTAQNLDKKLCLFVDWIIDERYRKSGLLFKFLKVAEEYCVQKKICAMYLFPNDLFGNVLKQLDGWKMVVSIATLEGNDLESNNTFNKVFHTIPLYEKTNFQNISDVIRKIIYHTNSIKIDKTPENFVWRFAKHPIYKYCLTYNELAFAVTKIFTDPVTGKRFGDIVDFECDLNDKKLLKELFLNASSQLLKLGAESVNTWALPHTTLYRVLKLMGFSETSQERYFCVKVLNSDYENLYDFSHWDIVQSDSEIY